MKRGSKAVRTKGLKYVFIPQINHPFCQDGQADAIIVQKSLRKKRILAK